MTLDEIKATNMSAANAKDIESRRLQNAYFVAKLIDKDTPQMINDGELHRLSYLFNTECKGWHYAWVGNRFTSKNTDHVFSISIFLPSIEKQDDPMNILYKPLAYFSSPHFTIASLRRKKEAEERREKSNGADEPKAGDGSDNDDDAPIIIHERDDPNIDQINQIKAKNLGESATESTPIVVVVQEKVGVPIPTGKSVENKTVETDLCEYGYVKKTITVQPQSKPRQPTTLYNGSMLRNGEIDRSIAAACTPLTALISSMKFPSGDDTMHVTKSRAKHYEIEMGNLPLNHNIVNISNSINTHHNNYAPIENSFDQMRQAAWRSRVPSNISLPFANKMKVCYHFTIFFISIVIIIPLIGCVFLV